MRLNNRGQSATETLIMITAGIAVAGGLLAVCYLAFARTWLTYQSDQMLFCIAETGRIERCRSKAIVKMKPALSFGQMSLAAYQLGDHAWRSHLVWTPTVAWPDRHSFRQDIRRTLNPDSPSWRSP